jgi:hypothetical protein
MQYETLTHKIPADDGSNYDCRVYFPEIRGPVRSMTKCLFKEKGVKAEEDPPFGQAL